MDRPFPHLLSPIRIGGVLFRNRIFAAPTGLHACQDGSPVPTEAAIAEYESRARGGAACVTCVGASIYPEDPASRRSFWSLYDPMSLHAVARLARRIQLHGARATMELGVAGIAARKLSVSADAPNLWGGFGKEMTEADIQDMTAHFAEAAARLCQAGFDMVLLHFGHSMPVAQFLSPLTNHRTDRYGGSFENRVRFLIEIIDAIRSRVGRGILIEVRISGTEYEPGGIPLEESVAFARLIQDKVDLIQFSAGMHGPKWFTTLHPCGFLPPTPNVWLAAEAKAAGLSVPVAAVGGIQDLPGAEAILAAGQADVLHIARGLIADPKLVQKARENRPGDVRPCIKCMRCHDSAVYEDRFVCSVNPEVGLAHCLPLPQRSGAPKKVAVLGGGPAGMAAALFAAERGHTVTLYEKEPVLGGTLRFSDHVSFKYPLRAYKDYLLRQLAASPVRVVTGCAASPEALREAGYDAVIPALGAAPAVPDIPGIGLAVPARDIFGREGEVGPCVAVIGGGEIGCETALHLAASGRRVTILQRPDALAPDASRTHRDELLLKIADTPAITVKTGCTCTAVTPDGVVITGRECGSVPADSVVLAAGMRPRRAEADAWLSAAPCVLPIGDCERAANVEHAVRSAYIAAMSL